MKDIPERSRCCSASILPVPGKLYCHGCGRTILDAGRRKRPSLLAELYWLPGEERIDLMFRNLRVAYARDVPEFSADLSEVISRSYKWVIGCSDADFSRIANALRLKPNLPNYPGLWNFMTLNEAAESLYLHLPDHQFIKHWTDTAGVMA